MITLTEKQERQIFLDLAQYSYLESGARNGLGNFYKSEGGKRGNRSAITSRVQTVYRKILKNPKRFDISPETIEVVQKSIATRRTNLGALVDRTENKPEEYYNPKDYEAMAINDLVGITKKDAWVVLKKKLDMLKYSKFQLRKTPVAALAQVAGITFDKGQIMKGEATEHIMLKAKIGQDMTPAQKMEMILKMREQTAGVREEE